jgi:hypothetical protein
MVLSPGESFRFISGFYHEDNSKRLFSLILGKRPKCVTHLELNIFLEAVLEFYNTEVIEVIYSYMAGLLFVHR